jgi:hypothetical protein
MNRSKVTVQTSCRGRSFRVTRALGGRPSQCLPQSGMCRDRAHSAGGQGRHRTPDRRRLSGVPSSFGIRHHALLRQLSVANPSGRQPDYDRGELAPVRDLRVWPLHCCRPCREPAIHCPGLRCRGEPHSVRMCRRRLRTPWSPNPGDFGQRRHCVLARARTTDGP